MSKSLQDQLLALGLTKTQHQQKTPAKQNQHRGMGGATAGKPRASERERAQASRQKSTRNTPVASHEARNSSGAEPSLEEAYRIREQQAKLQEERAREAKRLQDLQRRKINNEIRAIVDSQRLNDPAAELARNFVYKGRIRKIHVNSAQLAALNAGQLGVVYLAGGYHLLDLQHIEQVRALSAEHVPDLSGAAPGDEDEEYPVPDDLVW